MFKLSRLTMTVSGLTLIGLLWLGLPQAAAAQGQTPTNPNPIPFDNLTSYCTDTDSTTDDGETTVPTSQLLKGFSQRSLRYRLRCDPLITGKSINGQPTVGIYNFSKSLVNLGVLVILVIVAFANILRIKIDTYGAKKAIPLLLFGVVMANLALPIIRTIVDFSSVMTVSIISAASQDGTLTSFTDNLVKAVYMGGPSAISDVFNGFNSGSFKWSSFIAIMSFLGFAVFATGPFLGAIIIVTIFLITIPAIMFLYLGLLFVARIYILVILAALSPLAFASLGFQPVRSMVWNKWWDMFIKWTFMVPATFFLLWLGVQFFLAVGGQPDIGTYIIILILIGTATQIPTKWGGDLMKRWAKLAADPIKDFAFNRTREAVQAVPQTARKNLATTANYIGRTLKANSPFPDIPRNLKALGQGLEERLQQAERNSRQAASARRYEQLGRSGTFTNLRNFNVNNLPGQNRDLTIPNDIATQALGRYGLSEGDWADFSRLNQIDAQNFIANNTQERQSGNPNRVMGAYLANAKAGRVLNDQEHEEFMTALHSAGLSQQEINTLRYQYYQQFNRNQRFGVATTELLNPDNSIAQTNEERKVAFSRQENHNFRDNLTRRQQEEAMAKMVQYLTDPTGNLGYQTDDFESNTNLFGYANTILSNIDRQDNTGNYIFDQLRNRPVITQLRRMADQLAVAHTSLDRQLSPAAATNLAATITARIGVPVGPNDFSPLFSPGAINPRSWPGLTLEQRHAARESLTHPQTFVALKTSLNNYMNGVVTRLQANPNIRLNAAQAGNVQTLINAALDVNNSQVYPSRITQAQINQIFPGNTDLARRVFAALRSYNVTADNIDRLQDMIRNNIATI